MSPFIHLFFSETLLFLKSQIITIFTIRVKAIKAEHLYTNLRPQPSPHITLTTPLFVNNPAGDHLVVAGDETVGRHITTTKPFTILRFDPQYLGEPLFGDPQPPEIMMKWFGHVSFNRARCNRNSTPSLLRYTILPGTLLGSFFKTLGDVAC
ncbi:hypothetical protein HanXRQr2_Chr05g0196961 [Helianthus annuus]|uniref:Uncharacterized protein n=1 Tax=Helianthus annuus TaxID=4232 RepID=A0A9K3IX84_HELAN|nr:hypothetical protein HanXRQr2_Chr05g0196961 [Helianthus annuus]KAJ0921335.1 hypothetical protein HanPSC8_Chr05g0190261 [Helianthus annuus]